MFLGAWSQVLGNAVQLFLSTMSSEVQVGKASLLLAKSRLHIKGLFPTIIILKKTFINLKKLKVP